jgi:superfamily II DNA helicase RecQ
VPDKKPHIVVVVSPLIALMADQAEQLKEHHLSVANMSAKDDVWEGDLSHNLI